jgi:hypothetical protein
MDYVLSFLEHTAKKAAEQDLRFETESTASPEGSAVHRVEKITFP